MACGTGRVSEEFVDEGTNVGAGLAGFSHELPSGGENEQEPVRPT
jgi:hypothetical protein